MPGIEQSRIWARMCLRSGLQSFAAVETKREQAVELYLA